MNETPAYETIVDQLRFATATAAMRVVCPTCGGSLKVQVSSTAKRAMAVMCKSCLWRVVTDGLEDCPPWVADLGPKIETKS